MPSSPRKAVVDLHGHDVRTAVRLAMSRIAEAYGNGYDSIELIHGAGDVNEPVEEGRGRIKWELRRLAGGGAFDRFAYPDRTWLESGSVELTPPEKPRARPNSWDAGPARAHIQ